MQIFLLFQDPPQIVVRINELTFVENIEILRTNNKQTQCCYLKNYGVKLGKRAWL